MAEIILYSGSQRVAKTSKAFSVCIKKELMREYVLSFGVVNSDPVAKLVGEESVIEADGQKFDLVGFKRNSGSENITSVDAQHVNYRLLDYILPIGYSYTGTVAQIAQNILDLAANTNGIKANTEFTLGTCYDVGTKIFELNNTQTVTAKYALIAMKSLGVEVDYDNFTINLPQTVGSGNSETFRFGLNLEKIDVTYQKDNGTSYEIGMADLQKVPGHTGDVFDVGDTVTVIDSMTGHTITNRIITYTRCLDDPTKNAITLGVFVRDSADDSAASQVLIDNSVQVGEAYNEVSFSRVDGLVCAATIGTKAVKTYMSGTEGLAIKVDGVRVFGVNTSGRCFTQSISNLTDLSYNARAGQIVVGGVKKYGIGFYKDDTLKWFICQYEVGTFHSIAIYDENLKARVSIDNDGGFIIRDEQERQRLTTKSDGSFAVTDTSGNVTVWSDYPGDFTQIRCPSNGNMALGVDAAGPFKMVSGTKTYL